MGESDFTTDVNVTEKKFSKKLKFLLILAIFLTGMIAVFGFYSVMVMLQEEENITITAYSLISYLFDCMIFISLIRIYARKQFFIQSLQKNILIMGWMIICGAFIITHFSTYHSSGFSIMQYGSFILADGRMLTLGILFLVFSSLIKEGLEMQKEMDKIL